MYETNDLLTIKREALTSGDIDLLRDIREYEQNLTVIFKRVGEDAVRDHSGAIVDIDLPSILLALNAGAELSKPGQLLKKIREKKAETLLIEIAADAEFPITGSNFSKLRAEHSNEPDRIAGVKFMRPCPGVIFLSVDDLLAEQIEEIQEIIHPSLNY